MALFKSANPESKITRDLEAARARHSDLAERLRVAEASVAERTEAAHQLTRDAADDKSLDAALAAARVAHDKAGALAAAVAAVGKDVASLEAQAAEIADRKLRAETAAAIGVLGDRLTKAAATFDSAVAELSEVCTELSPIIVDAGGLRNFSQTVRTEFPPAIAQISQIIRNRIAATLDGTAPAGLPKPEAPQPVLRVVEPPKVRSVFIVRNCRFTDRNNAIRILRKGEIANDIPVGAAARALATGAAMPVSDPRVRDLSRTWTSGPLPHPDACEDLDDTPSSSEPVLHSAYAKPANGAAYIKPLRTPVAATRADPPTMKR
jgi:hypothetical protein